MSFPIQKLPQMILDDLKGKDSIGMTHEQEVTYRWIIIGLCILGIIVSWSTVIIPVILGGVAVRKLWINLHKKGFIPFG